MKDQPVDVIEFLQEKFKHMNYGTVTDWMRDKKVDLSLQSCTSVLLRGQDKGLVVMLTLASALGCSTEEIRWVAKQKGDKTLWRLITDSHLSKDESALIEHYRSMSVTQRKNLLFMADQMVSK